MKEDPRELPKDRLATINKKGGRNILYPAAVRGRFRKHRTLVQFILMIFFLVLPWIKIGGQQALLLDLARRQFSFFGLTLFAHDAPLIFFILGILTLGLAFITAIWGRVWCGWACPQTVFIDGVFRRIETWVEGNHIQRQRLDKAPLSFSKVAKKTIKISLFTLASLIITHSFLAYFVGTDRLTEMMQTSPKENWASFLFILITTGLVLFDFAWFREQFCIIACPYGRFQSVLMTSQSLAVLYDEKRGEPRKGSVPKGEAFADCVNCFKCVNVCPTGIDIRRGIQMECIACTACIDACDEVMEKIKKPIGLIRYDTEANLEGRPKKSKRPRILIYLFFILLMFAGLIIGLANRKDFNITVVRSHDKPFVVLKNEGDLILNHFKLHLKNHSFQKVSLSLKLADPRKDQIQLITPVNPIPFTGGQSQTVHFFLKFPKSITGEAGKTEMNIEFSSKDLGGYSELKRVKVLGP